MSYFYEHGALTCYNRQNVDVVHVVSEDIGIHALTILVNAKAQSTTDFLTLPDFAAALLQGANLEYIRVIPALAQSGMREDKTHRRPFWIAVEQQLFIFHDQLISADVIRGRFFSADFAVDHFALAVDGEIAGMRLFRRDRR